MSNFSQALRIPKFRDYIAGMNDLSPNLQEKLARMRAELGIGLLLNTDYGAFCAIEHLREERYQALQDQGDLMVVLSAARALDLQFSHDPSRDAVLRLPKDYRFDLLKALADPAMDMDYPGKGPLQQGELPRDFCARLLRFCRGSRVLPAVVFSPYQQMGASAFDNALWRMVEDNRPKLNFVARARVPLEQASDAQLHVFREESDGDEHHAIVMGRSVGETPLVRLHSECFTGDCLGSLKCDCGPQLHEALDRLGQEKGILLYLSQEGRGIGLPNKIRAYQLQDQGFDTVEANQKLGFDDDERDFRIGAEILKHFKINKVRLMTNNPRKIEWLETAGIEVVERVPIQIEPRAENRDYLEVKARKSGHML